MNKLNEDLESAYQLRIQKWNDSGSNSPINMSSDSDSDDCFEHGPLQKDDNNGDCNIFKKLTFREVQASIDKYYEDVHSYSNELDVLISYLKGQKHMYAKAVEITVIKMYIVLFPVVLGNIILSVLLFIEISPMVLLGLNIFVFLFYFINVWSEWGASLWSYRLCINQYELYIRSLDNKHEQVLDLLYTLENKMREWKEVVNVTVPWECKQMFPIIFRMHFFTFIKRIENYKKNLIMKFKDIKNEIRYIEWKFRENMLPKEVARLNFLYKIKEKIKCEILQHKNAYGCMQELLIKESQSIDCWIRLFFSKRVPTPDNPAILSYFATVFEDV